MSTNRNAEKARSFEDERPRKSSSNNLEGYVLETTYNEGNDIIEMWHHPCFREWKDSGRCKHSAEAGDWKKIVK